MRNAIKSLVVFSTVFLQDCNHQPRTIEDKGEPSKKIEVNNQSNRESDVSDSVIEKSLKKFQTALQFNNPNLLDSVIEIGGFTLIRNFTSGTLGGRGENFKGYYVTPIQEKILSFPVLNEFPIQLDSLFTNFLGLKNSKLSIFKNDSLDFISKNDSVLTKIPTDSLIKLVNSVLQKNYSSDIDYVVKFKNESIILIEQGQTIDNIPVGSFAVFTKSSTGYNLRGVFSFL